MLTQQEEGPEEAQNSVKTAGKRVPRRLKTVVKQQERKSEEA